MKRRRAPSINVHVSNRESEAIGLSLGRKIGLLDATTQPTSSGKFDKGKWDVLHRQLTVVDSYSAAVDIDALQRGRVNVLIQALGAEELFVRIPTADEDGLPPRGVKFWKHAFEGAELVERVGAEQFEVRREQERRANNHPAGHLETLGALAPVETKPGPARDKRPALVGPKGVNSV